MGCDFIFTNKTLCVTFEPDRNKYWLWKNINRGSSHHLINVILNIIQTNGWNITDKIEITCGCCSCYVFQNNTLFEYDEIVQDDNICDWKECPVCL